MFPNDWWICAGFLLIHIGFQEGNIKLGNKYALLIAGVALEICEYDQDCAAYLLNMHRLGSIMDFSFFPQVRFMDGWSIM